jgi:hypothetical protein
MTNYLLMLVAQLARSEAGNLTMPRIIFWLLLILWAIGHYGFGDNPQVSRGTSLVLIILFAILGFYLFGF